MKKTMGLAILFFCTSSFAQTVVQNNIFFYGNKPAAADSQKKSIVAMIQAVKNSSLPDAENFKMGRLQLNLAIVDANKTSFSFHAYIDENSIDGKACWLQLDFAVTAANQNISDINAQYSCDDTTED